VASHDGRYIVFSWNRDRRTNIWRMDISGENLLQLTDGTVNSNPELSPDSRWLIYSSLDHGSTTVWRMPIDGGKPTQLSKPTTNLPVVSPDGKQIVCFYWDEQADPQRGVMVFPFDGGEPTKRFRIAADAFVLHWTSDGGAILYVDSNLANIWSQPLAGGAPIQMTDLQGDQIFNFAYSQNGERLALARGRVTNDVLLISDSR
jgi:dipeptidyl aminopeptidase/acylaminoacyl peptidase